MHERDGAHAAYGLLERAPALGVLGQPPGLQPQQRGDGLQVVLHPVVDLPDGRVLGHQLALAPAQLADVAQQDERGGPHAVVHDRDGPQGQGRAVGLQLGPPGRPAADHQGQALVDAVAAVDQRRDDLGQRRADHLAGVADPVHGRDGVGAGVVDDPLGVEPDEPVADPGRPAARAGRRARRPGKLPAAIIRARSSAADR